MPKHGNKSEIRSSSSGDKSSVMENDLVKAIKHIDTFYEKPPPGLIQTEEKERPEDCIPDTPQNQAAREFLAKAPSKGLWMPLGKEVKVMQCWRCKNFGHRTGDKECPLFLQGNPGSERFRYVHEDPMFNYVNEKMNKDQHERIDKLKALLEESSSSSGTDSSSSSPSSSSSSSSNHGKRKSSSSTNSSSKRKRQRSSSKSRKCDEKSHKKKKKDKKTKHKKKKCKK